MVLVNDPLTCAFFFSLTNFVSCEGQLFFLLLLCSLWVHNAGMNTGIQDAHNLAWKISSLLNGIAPWSILQTYETERRPV